MPAAHIPDDDQLRVEALNSYNILDTLPEQGYDQITCLAANICETPISLVSLVGVDRQWFKSKNGLDASATSRDLAFCAHAILHPDKPLIIEDATKDVRFLDNDLVTGPLNIRFYAGIPLMMSSGFPIGTLCVIDQKPKKITSRQLESLTILAASVVTLLELRKSKLEQNTLIEQLSSSNEQLEQFAYIASHDLQEPIRMVSCYVSLLKKRYEGNLDSNADKYIGYAVDGCSRMQNLISGLLEFAQVDTNIYEAEYVKCHDVLEQIILDLSLTIEETNAKISWDNILTTITVPPQLKIVFRNLIGNALKYCSGHSPEIRIESETLGNQVKFSVIDNGIGIKLEYHTKIFELFKRLNSRNEFSGTGIGLTISKKIISRYGGEISLESIPGEGTTFHFTIPIIDKLSLTK